MAQQWQEVGSPQNEFNTISPLPASYTDIVTDNQGIPYVVFKEPANAKITVKKFVGGAWVTVGNASFSNTAIDINIAIDGNNTPYIAYRDQNNGNKATVMRFNGVSWVNVGSSAFTAGTAYYISLAIAANGMPYIGFQDGANSNKVTVMKYNGNSWEIVGSAGFSAGVADYPSLAISASGTPYISYKDLANASKVSVMMYNGTSWVVVGTAGFSNALIKYSALTIDNMGNPYITYINNSNIIVNKYDGSSWVSVGAGITPLYYGSDLMMSIAVDGNGIVYVGNGQKGLMKCVGGVWTYVTRGYYSHWGSGGGQYDYNNLAISPSGIVYWVYSFPGITPNVVSYDGNNTNLVPIRGISAEKYYYNSMTNNCLAIDTLGMPYTTYSTNNDSLVVKKYNGTNWVNVGNKLQGNVKGLVIGSDNIPYISLIDSNIATVMKFNGSSWVNVGIPNFSPSNIYVNTLSLALDSANTPYVLYQHNYNQQLSNVMKYDGNNWITVGSSNIQTSSGFSLKIAPNGTPYFLSDNIVMKYDGSAWVTVGNTSTGSVYSIEIDSNNTPYILFGDYNTSYKATVMKYDGTNWVTVGSGAFSAAGLNQGAITINSAGNPVVSYIEYGTTKVSSKLFNGTSWVNLGNASFSVNGASKVNIAMDKLGKYYTAYSAGQLFVRSNAGPSTPNLTITATPSTTVCLGATINYTATTTNPNNAFAISNYQWKKNGSNIGTNSSSLSLVAGNNVLNGDIISCVISYSTSGGSGTTTSNSLTTAINTSPTVSVNISDASPCAGTTVIYTATVTNPTSCFTISNYQWKKNGVNIGTNSNSLSLIAVSTVLSTDVITCTISYSGNTNGTATSNNMIVTTGVPIATISATPTGTINIGTTVNYTVSLTAPNSCFTTYQWVQNGVNVGTNSNTLSLVAGTSVVNGDSIYCIITSSTNITVYSNSITAAVAQLPTVSISTNMPSTPICYGTTITYTATPTNPGSAFTITNYQWKKNGGNIGTNSSTLILTTGSSFYSGNVITCVITYTGLYSGTSTSNALTANITYTSLGITIDSNPTGNLCFGDTVVYTATNNGNCYTISTYQWRKNGINIGSNSPTLSLIAGTNLFTGNEITCYVSYTSPGTGTAISNTLIAGIGPSITISSSAGSVCVGNSMTYTATVNMPSCYTITNYQWKRSGYNIGTNNPSLTLLAGTNLFYGDNVSCVVTYAGAANGVVTSNSLYSYVAQSQNVSIASSTGSNYACQGNSITFEPIFSPYSSNQNYTYSWYKNGALVSTNSSYVANTLVTGDVIEITTNSLNNTCQNPNPFSSPPMTMNVINPSISISTNSTTTCANASVTFTATAPVTAPNPQFNWKVGATTIATTTVPYYTFSPFNFSNNSVVTCELVTAGCTIVSNSVTMSVLPTGYGYVNIAVSQNNLCSTNNTATFTASPYYGSYVNPTFQWKKNGLAIAGATSTTYNATGLVNGDIFVCEMITNNLCLPIISSNAIAMNIVGTNSLAVPTITIKDNAWYGGDGSFVYTCSGSYVGLTAITTFAGANPSYQWKKNGVAIGTNSPGLWSPISNGDVITCEMTSSLGCAITTPVSDAVNVIVSNDDLLVQYFCDTKEACVGDVITYTADYQKCAYCDDGYEIPYYTWFDIYGSGNYIYNSAYSYTVDSMFYNDIFGLELDLYEGLYSTCPTLYNPSNANGYFEGVFNGDAPIIYYSSFTPSVTIAANNTGSPCSVNVLIFSATATGGGANATYQWKKNGVNIPDATFKQVAFNNLNSGDIITCEMTSSLSCASPAMVTSNAITVSGGMGGMASLSLAANSICAGGTVNVNLTGGNAGATYTWQVSTNSGTTWTNITGYVNTTNTAFSNVPGSSRSYRVIVNDPICGVYTTGAVALMLVADPVLTVTPSNNNFCAGGNTTLTTAVTGGLGTNSYQWQQYIGTTWTNIAGATSASYTASNLSATTNYRANLTQNVSGCAASTISAITVKPLPNITTNPALPKYCVGGTVSIAAAGGSNYSWSPATGLSVATGSPVVASGTISTTYSLTGTGTNGCTKTIAVPVTVNQDPGIVVTGASTVCVGSTTTLTANTTGGAGTCTIQWQKSTNGTTWSSISGATGATYTTPAMTTNAYYRATYTCNGGGCSPAAASSSLLVSVVNLQPVLSLVEPTICTGGTAVVNLTGGNAATTYTWQVSTNSGATWTNITGYVNTTSTSFSHVPGTSRSYQVIANDPACGIITTNSANITLISDPVLTVTSSNNNFCAGGNTTLSTAVTGGLGTNSYQWQQYIGTTWTNIAGATGASYTGTNLSATTSYRANLTQSVSGCGASTISAITVKTLPNITTSPAAPTYCVGGTVSIAAAGGSNYSWSPATGLSAATGSPVVASGTSSTTYSLTGTGTNGCTKTISVPVTVKADPTITVTGPTSVPTGTGASLSATTNGGSGTCTLQWQSSTNGTTWSSISGATAATYTTPAITGTKYYRATYTCNGSGCSPAGTSNVLTIIGIQPPVRLGEKVYDLTLYPNPASVNLTVSLSTTADEKADFIITDMLGKTLTQWEGKAENGVYENEISIENLSQGVYFLSVKIGERVMTQKFVKE